MKKNDSTAYQKYFYNNGAPVASTGTLESVTLDYNYTPISDRYPPTSPGQYIVQRDGESLQDIAAAVYGDAGVWYLIADANGLSGGETLLAGRALTIPNEVTNLHNNSQTFKPYNAGDVIGDVTPALKAPPPPKHHCGVFAQVMVIVVAVAVTALTTGLAIPALAGALGAATATGVAATALGAAAIAGGAAVGAAAGSIASQLTANALELQDGFSWSAVGTAALVAGLTAGLSAEAGNLLDIGGRLSASGIAGFKFSDVAMGALNFGIGAGVNVALNQPHAFSWASLTAAVVTSGLVGGGTTGNSATDRATRASTLGRDFFGNFTRNLEAGVINRSVTIAMEGHGKLELQNIAADAFGNAIGNSIVSVIQDSEAEKQTAQINQNLDEESQQAQQQIDERFAQSQQEINDQISTAFDAQVDNDIATASIEHSIVADAEAGFASPSLNGLAKQAANLQIDIASETRKAMVDVAKLNAKQADELPYFALGHPDSPDAVYPTARGASGSWAYGGASGSWEAPASTYDKISIATHGALSVGGMVPVLGVVPDILDLAYTAAEIPFGKSSALDLTLAGVGIAATLAPGADQVAGAAKLAARTEAAASIREARNILREARPDLTVAERNQIIKAFDLESFRVSTITREVTEFRYFDNLPDGAGLSGRWSTPQWLETPAERIGVLALPNNQATRAATVTLQPGSTIFTGTVAPQLRYGPNLTGGGLQTYNAVGPRAVIEELR